MEKHSTVASNVIPFDFDKRPVRAILIDDQPWFVASDVALALQYSEAKDMTRNLDDDEKGRQIVPTLGGDQEMLVINESGLYSAILRSRKPEARRFKKWVTAEVLPSIRKHGRYADGARGLDTLLGSTIGTNGFNVLGSVIKGKVARLPKEARRRATMKIWSQAHTAFGVRSAQDIPAEQLDAARNFIAAYAIEGEWLASDEHNPAAAAPAQRRPIDLLPPAQAKEITDRLRRLSHLFHPFSEQFGDVLGIDRALRGLHPRIGLPEAGYLQALPRIS